MNLALNLNITSKYSVTNLVLALSKNLEAHKEDYKVAVENYNATVAEKLLELSKIAKKAVETVSTEEVEKKYRELMALKKPVDASKLYEQYINILSNSSEETVELTANDANAILNDAWTWAQEAKLTNSFYSSKF